MPIVPLLLVLALFGSAGDRADSGAPHPTDASHPADAPHSAEDAESLTLAALDVRESLLPASGTLARPLGDKGPVGPGFGPITRGTLRVTTLDALPLRILRPGIAATRRHLEFGALDALIRAGRLSWRTTAPPPFRIV